MIADNQTGFSDSRRSGGELRKLDQQAIAEIFGGDADRIEALDPLEHGFHFIEANLFIANPFQNIFHRDGEIAGIVHRVDDRGGNRPVGIGKRRQLNLPHQIILKRLGGFTLINR